MRKLLLVLLMGLFASTAFASVKSDCEAKATEKNLEDAANKKYVAKCVKDAKKASARAVANASKKKCEEKAGDKNLEGKEKKVFIKKCMKDAKKAATSEK
jgi:hypothetical protein